MERMPFFYFAGPDVFYKHRIDFVAEEIKILKNELCFDYHYPGDVDASTSLDIFRKNERALIKADAVIANIADFRSPQMDVGTAWEIGYAFSRKIPVFAYDTVHDTLSVAQKMPENAYYYTENFGYSQNLMIIESIFAKTVFADMVTAVKIADSALRLKGV